MRPIRRAWRAGRHDDRGHQAQPQPLERLVGAPGRPDGRPAVHDRGGDLLLPGAPGVPGGAASAALFSVAIPLTKVVLDLPLAMYFVALIVVGAAIQGDVIGGGRFLVVNAPPARRISYMGFLNTVTSPLTLLPFAGAAVMRYWSATALYWMILGGVCCTWCRRSGSSESGRRRRPPRIGGRGGRGEYRGGMNLRRTQNIEFLPDPFASPRQRQQEAPCAATSAGRRRR